MHTQGPCRVNWTGQFGSVDSTVAFKTDARGYRFNLTGYHRSFQELKKNIVWCAMIFLRFHATMASCVKQSGTSVDACKTDQRGYRWQVNSIGRFRNKKKLSSDVLSFSDSMPLWSAMTRLALNETEQMNVMFNKDPGVNHSNRGGIHWRFCQCFVLKVSNLKILVN